jgi:hypothetical protein
MAPAVSVAIRAFRRQWLADAIHSVLTQTFADLELVLYDCAGDLEPVAAAARDSRVRYYRGGSAPDPSARFRAAVGRCRGRFVALLDDDDRYEPGFLAQLVDVLERQPDIGIAFCRTTWDAGGVRSRPADPRLPGRQRDIVRDMLERGWTVSPSHMVMRRSAVADAWRVLPMPDGVAPDVFVNIGAALAGWRHALVDAHLVVCRWHRGQLSRQPAAAIERAMATWRALEFTDPWLGVLRDRRLARVHVVRAIERLATGDRRGAREDEASAARMAPEAWIGPRAIVRAALATGPVGSAAARFWLRHAPRGHRRDPPAGFGDR